MKYSCPACDAPIRLREELEPGKRIRCPKCGEPFSISAGKGDHARPAKRREKQESGQSNAVLYAGLGVLAVALVAVGVVVAVVLSRPAAQPVNVAAAPPPAPRPQPEPPPPRPPEPTPQPPAPDPNAVAVRPAPKEVTPTPEKPREPKRDPGPTPPVGFEIGNLAPDIVGEDTDGRSFKLSDYRGKVVVLDFWGHW